MSLADDHKLTQYILNCDNPYSVVNTIAAIARNKTLQYNNKILHSQALTWVIQGIQPEEVTEANNPSVIDKYEFAYITEVFCYVDDDDIKSAVYKSYIVSKKNKHLIYKYQSLVDESKRAKVRVLTRLLWDKLYI